MYIFSPEKYSKNYKNLDRVNKKYKTIISLTSSPSKLKKIKPVINSLLDQTVKVDLISITVPYGKQYVLPDNLKNIVQIFRAGKNYQDATSLIPVILREEDATTTIINVGDDTIYGKDFIER